MTHACNGRTWQQMHCYCCSLNHMILGWCQSDSIFYRFVFYFFYRFPFYFVCDQTFPTFAKKALCINKYYNWWTNTCAMLQIAFLCLVFLSVNIFRFAQYITLQALLVLSSNYIFVEPHVIPKNRHCNTMPILCHGWMWYKVVKPGFVLLYL